MKSVEERFLSKFTKNGPIFEDKGPCWEWSDALHNGYGRIKINGKQIRAHRFSYEYYGGTLDPKLVIDHLCKNTCCVNPAHLEQVTASENTLRGVSSPAVNARKTHCDSGHDLSADNVYVDKSGSCAGWRRCKACSDSRRLRLKAKIKQSARLPKPDKDVLAEELKTESFQSLGLKYGYTDNAVRKWAKKYGLL